MMRILGQIITQNDIEEANIPTTSLNSDSIGRILQIVFGVIGAMAVIYIIIAAISYSASAGNPQATGKLRNRIIYAAVGLIAVVAAEAIVTFVLVEI